MFDSLFWMADEILVDSEVEGDWGNFLPSHKISRYCQDLFLANWWPREAPYEEARCLFVQIAFCHKPFWQASESKENDQKKNCHRSSLRARVYTPPTTNRLPSRLCSMQLAFYRDTSLSTQKRALKNMHNFSKFTYLIIIIQLLIIGDWAYITWEWPTCLSPYISVNVDSNIFGILVPRGKNSSSSLEIWDFAFDSGTRNCESPSGGNTHFPSRIYKKHFLYSQKYFSHT